MDTSTTHAPSASCATEAATPLSRAIELTMRAATSWVGFLTAYAGAVAAAILAFQQLSQHLGNWPVWTRVVLVSSLPIAVLVFHTIPTLVDQRRKRRLSEISGTLQSGYFRLAPREEEASFSRADGKHHEILKWLVERDKATLLYLTGASGSGKSSLLAAWALPHLERQGTHVIRLRGFQDPFDMLEEELRKPGVIWQKPSTEKLNLTTLFRSASRHIRPKRLLVVLDQFEEFVILRDHEQQQRFEQIFSDLLKDAATSNLTFLLVFRSDYIGLIEKLSLPLLAQDANWKEIPPFTERAAQAFIRESGLEVSDGLLRDVLREAAEIEQTKGLIRPVTVNLCGLVLGRFASGLPRGFRSGGLIRGFLRESVLLPSIREVSTRLIPHLITNYVTKRPRKIDELAQDSGLDPAAIRGCLRVLGQSDRAVVRPLDADQQTWEVSHDFLVPLLDSIMARWRISFWRRTRPWLPWIAMTTLVVGAVAASTWRKDPIVELTDMGWSVTKTSTGLDLSFAGVPPKGSLAALQRTRATLNVRVGAIDATISEWSVLPNLSTLKVTGKHVSNLEPLKDLTNLSTLDLSRTEISNLEPLKGLTNLSSLDLSLTKVSNLEPLKGLVNLSTLSLGDTRVTNLDPIKGLTQLSKLDVGGTGISNLDPLKGLRNLSTLDLTETGVSNLEPLKLLANLQTLSLMDTQIRDLDLEQLKNLTNLNQLDLSSTRVSNLNPLEGLTHLSKLHIFNTQVSETSINDLKNANKNLEITRSAVFNPH